MRELAVAIQNENEKVSIIETINSIKNIGFKNVFVQWYDENWEHSQEEQIKLCKELGFNYICTHYKKLLFTEFRNKKLTDKKLKEKGVIRVNNWLDVKKELLYI